MKRWQTAFLFSCAVHLFLFNLPDFLGETPTEEITRRSPIVLRVIDPPPSHKKPSTKKITQKMKDRPRKAFRKKIKKVKQEKRLAKRSPPRPEQSKQKKIPEPSIAPGFPERFAPQLASPAPKQKTEAREKRPPAEAAPTPLKQNFAPKIAAVKPSRKRGFFKDLKIIHRLIPVYPIVARREGREGVARIKIQILENGDLGSVELSRTSGSSDLDNAALKAIQSWQFEPAMRNGIPVRQSAIFPVAFVLD